jgi:hypothetical protein
VVDYIKHWHVRTGITRKQLLNWLELPASKYHDWQTRYGKANEHDGQIPRDFWVEDWEKKAIINVVAVPVEETFLWSMEAIRLAPSYPKLVRSAGLVALESSKRLTTKVWPSAL